MLYLIEYSQKGSGTETVKGIDGLLQARITACRAAKKSVSSSVRIYSKVINPPARVSYVVSEVVYYEDGQCFAYDVGSKEMRYVSPSTGQMRGTVMTRK